jgi:hypothetical protein
MDSNARMMIILDPNDPEFIRIGACGTNSKDKQATVENRSNEDPDGPKGKVKDITLVVKYTNPCVWIGNKRVCW